MAGADLEGRAVGIDRDGVGGIGLQFDCGGSALGDRIYDREGAAEIAVVVPRHLSGDEWAVPFADCVVTKVDRLGCVLMLRHAPDHTADVRVAF